MEPVSECVGAVQAARNSGTACRRRGLRLCQRGRGRSSEVALTSSSLGGMTTELALERIQHRCVRARLTPSVMLLSHAAEGCWAIIAIRRLLDSEVDVPD